MAGPVAMAWGVMEMKLPPHTSPISCTLSIKIVAWELDVVVAIGAGLPSPLRLDQPVFCTKERQCSFDLRPEVASNLGVLVGGHFHTDTAAHVDVFVAADRGLWTAHRPKIHGF